MSLNALRIKRCPKCREDLREYNSHWSCEDHGQFESWKCALCGANVYGFNLPDGHTLLCANCLRETRKRAFEKTIDEMINDDTLHRKFVQDVIENPELAFREYKAKKMLEKLERGGEK